MFLKLAFERNTPEEVNEAVNQYVPSLIRVPFTLSSKFLGTKTFGEISTSKKIVQNSSSNISVAFNAAENSGKRFYFISNAQNAWDCIKAAGASLVLIPPIFTFLLLFNWLIFYLVPSILDGKSLEEIEELEKEFYSLSRKFFFGRIVRRKTRKLFLNAKSVGGLARSLGELSLSIDSIKIRENESHCSPNDTADEARLIEEQKAVKPFSHSATKGKMKNLFRGLEQYHFVDKQDSEFFLSLLFPELVLFTDNDFFPVQWLGYNIEVYFLFACFEYFEVITVVEWTSIGSKIESNFFDKNGMYLKNLSKCKSDFSKAGLSAREYASSHSGHYKMIFDLVELIFTT